MTPIRITFLTRITRNRRLQVIWQPGLLNEFLRFIDSAIGQSVHWINDDGPRERRTTCQPGTECLVNNWHKEAQRFS